MCLTLFLDNQALSLPNVMLLALPVALSTALTLSIPLGAIVHHALDFVPRQPGPVFAERDAACVASGSVNSADPEYPIGVDLKSDSHVGIPDRSRGTLMVNDPSSLLNFVKDL
jgi:hypothetical protein